MVYVFVCMYVCVLCLHVCFGVCVFEHVSACMFVRMCVCVHVVSAHNPL